MMSPMWRFCAASSSGATSAPIALQWNLRNLPPMALQRITDAGDRSLILILSDVNMPGMSGLELLPKAKALRPDVPVIMITAYGDAETKRRALESGAEALLTKPIDFETLRSEIDTRIEHRITSS
jgi:CheY-like chemotaxis protein